MPAGFNGYGKTTERKHTVRAEVVNIGDRRRYKQKGMERAKEEEEL